MQSIVVCTQKRSSFNGPPVDLCWQADTGIPVPWAARSVPLNDGRFHVSQHDRASFQGYNLG
jgi:hypothetical protein